MLLEMPCCNRVGFIAGGNLLQDAKFDDTCSLIEKRGFGVTNLTIPKQVGTGAVLPRAPTCDERIVHKVHRGPVREQVTGDPP